MLKYHWYIACKAIDIRRSPVAFTAFDQPLVAFRGENGVPGVLIDRCAHRNAALSKGKVTNGALQCPYHGWQYSTDGQVVNIPVCPKSIQPETKTSVQSWPCLEQDGYIWFCLSKQPATASPTRFANKSEPGWTSFTMDTLFDGPVDTCLENFLDCPHATFVHKHWFRAPTLKNVSAIVRTNVDGAEAEYFDEPRESSLVWSLLSKDSSNMRHVDRFIAPATSRVDYEFSDNRYYIITSSCTPISETKTRVHTVISFRFGRIGWFVKLFFKPLSQRIIAQDVHMVRLQQDNIDRFGGKRYQVIKQDLLYRHIVSWRNRIEKNEPMPEQGEPETIDLVL